MTFLLYQRTQDISTTPFRVTVMRENNTLKDFKHARHIISLSLKRSLLRSFISIKHLNSLMRKKYNKLIPFSDKLRWKLTENIFVLKATYLLSEYFRNQCYKHAIPKKHYIWNQRYNVINMQLLVPKRAMKALLPQKQTYY
jgi:hypothetical protein